MKKGIKSMKLRRALLVVDVQNDFLPGGALGIKGGDTVIPALNNYLKLFLKKKLPIFASRDWHPPETFHFKVFGGDWPKHCIRDTKGAQFDSRLKLPKEAILLYKGMDPHQDSYSVFQAQDKSGVSFESLLKILGINRLYIGGLATDYCVKFTSFDALRRGYEANILIDAVKGVDRKPQDSEQALQECVKAGGKIISLEEVEEELHA